MHSGGDRTDELREVLRQRVLVLDGATGTMLQDANLEAADFGGPELEGCNEILVETRPDVILDVHRAYLAAGADIIETDTFGGTPLVLDEYGLGGRAEELNRLAAELARRAAEEYATSAKPRFVAGSIGPTTRSITVTGGVTFSELRGHFRRQTRGLVEGGVDLLLIETCQDTRNTKAALLAAEDVFAELGERRPVAVSGTVEPMGTMLAGQTAEALTISLDHADLLFLGLNCATGPEFMTDHIRTLHHLARCPVSCYPNAGLPDEDGRYGETPDGLARALERFVDRGWLNLVGGCCGTTDAHIRALAAMVDGKRPRPEREGARTRVFYSGVELVESTEANRPLLVGERTNVIGSRRFRRLVAEGAWDEAAEIARRQVRKGAQIVDVCLQDPDADELTAVDELYGRLARMVKVPLMIDTTDPEVVERALTYCQGKAIVNSVNLEDGEERLEAVCPLLSRYGAAVVAGCIDEDPDQAQAFTRERKLEVAVRLRGLLTGAYGLADTDLVFDPLVFPAASGDEGYIGGAVETIEGVRAIKREFPRARTILGVSNVSFGLPTAAREVVNSVFLHLATKAGLDLAIVNTERLERFASIPQADREMAEDLLTNRPPAVIPADHPEAELFAGAPDDWRSQTPEQRAALNRFHIARLTERFRGVRQSATVDAELPPVERAARCIVEGTRDGLIPALDALLDRGLGPLRIINGPLMDGMAEVGRLFNDNQLIVAEVLQSAEAMKTAVAHLEPHLEAGESTHRGRVVLATVKGDVHDIGKNLVHIILANNGYEVVDLGIKVPPERLIQAAREHHPEAVGLSGLLVKSAQQMVVTAADLRDAGLEIPILVGGAALSEKFTRTRIAPAAAAGAIYCADAMAGLSALNGLLEGDLPKTAFASGGDAEPVAGPAPADPARARRTVRTDLPPLPPPDTRRHVRLRLPDLRELWSWINPQMLYGKHLGLKGGYARKLADRDPKALELTEAVAVIQQEALDWMRVAAVWRFFEAEADGDTIEVFAPGDDVAAWRWTFPRQRGGGLCLADLVATPRDGVRDSLALFVVTAGEGVRERSLDARERGEYLRSHVIQSLALETAEAAAEWLHRRLREDWGFPDPEDVTMLDRFKARYRGRRYSFGYPACPDLDGQRGLFALLDPGEIGVELTEGLMMDPEASVSALVFHHPDATYFGAG